MSDALRPIPGFDGYSVTADGRVLSRAHTIVERGGRERYLREKWLHQRIGEHGYPTTVLTIAGKRFQLYVHRAVALAWVENTNPAQFNEVNHLNGVKSDPRAENLEWCDRAHNTRHAYATGLKLPSRILTDAQVLEIRAARAMGVRVGELARLFSCSRQAISCWTVGAYKNVIVTMKPPKVPKSLQKPAPDLVDKASERTEGAAA